MQVSSLRFVCSAKIPENMSQVGENLGIVRSSAAGFGESRSRCCKLSGQGFGNAEVVYRRGVAGRQ